LNAFDVATETSSVGDDDSGGTSALRIADLESECGKQIVRKELSAELNKNGISENVTDLRDKGAAAPINHKNEWTRPGRLLSRLWIIWTRWYAFRRI
jgi:hypothetical protein